MTIDQIVSAVVVAAIFIAPLAALGVAALRFGTDSRPGVEVAHPRPWLVPGA